MWLYERAIEFGFVNPEELRHWAREDLFWVKAVKDAQLLRDVELDRRAKVKRGELTDPE